MNTTELLYKHFIRNCSSSLLCKIGIWRYLSTVRQRIFGT